MQGQPAGRPSSMTERSTPVCRVHLCKHCCIHTATYFLHKAGPQEVLQCHASPQAWPDSPLLFELTLAAACTSCRRHNQCRVAVCAHQASSRLPLCCLQHAVGHLVDAWLLVGLHSNGLLQVFRQLNGALQLLVGGWHLCRCRCRRRPTARGPSPWHAS